MGINVWERLRVFVTSRKISDLGRTPYGTEHPRTKEVLSCEPSNDEIGTAIDNRELEQIPFSDTDQNALAEKWSREANGDFKKFGEIQRRYHAQRIAALVVEGWTDPIEIDENDRIVDGNHRVRAALFRGDSEIAVLVKNQKAD